MPLSLLNGTHSYIAGDGGGVVVYFFIFLFFYVILCDVKCSLGSISMSP